jgi:FdhE protein
MNKWWDKQIQRADELLQQSNGSQDLVKFYGHLLRSQKTIYEYLRSRRDWRPSCEIEIDFPIIREGLSHLLNTVQSHGPQPLSSEAKGLLESNPETLFELLAQYWYTSSDVLFFGKACLQPYLKWLREKDSKPVGRETPNTECRCPFCGGNPQVSFLHQEEPGADSGNRDLICGSCLTSWGFRRVVCANCGEERPAKLGYFHSPEFDHVRIEACDSCNHYIKGIDLTRLGYAVPLVDEIHSAALDLWARDHGYRKIELNLVGV